MKTILISIFTSVALFLNAQNSAGIFQFSYHIDKELTQETLLKNDNKNFFTSFSSSEPLPDYFVDSIITVTENTISQKYNYNAKVVYFKNKKGKNLETIPVNGMVGGLPASSFKKIIKQYPDNDYFVKVFASLYSSGGVKYDFGFEAYATIKPRFTLKIVILDKKGKTISKETINLNDLTKVKSYEHDFIFNNRNYKYTETKGLTSLDLFAIYKMGMEKFLKKK